MTDLRTLPALILLIATTACTDVELCHEDSHPHKAQVKFVHEWNEYEDDADRPDSMYVIANRVINFWKMTAAIYTKKGEPNEGMGRYVFNRLPEKEQEPAGPEQPTEPEEEVTPTVPDDSGDTDTPETPGNQEKGGGTEATQSSGPSQMPRKSQEAPDPAVYDKEVFDLQVGEYKFYTFTATDQMDTKNVDKFISTDDNNMTNEGFTFEYNTYNKEDAAFTDAVNRMMEPLAEKGFSGWNDFNPYSKYMLPASRPLFIDSVNITPITQNGTTKITFSPKPATQTVTINIKVRKVFGEGCTFKVEGIIGEVSGVPSTINLSNGFVDITTTNKMMFPFGIANMEEDTEDNDFLQCTARINVPGIVRSNSDEATIGPGLLQAFVYCTIYREGKEPLKRKIQGILNLYDELTTADMIEITDDGNHAKLVGREHTLDIGAEIIIDGNATMPDTEEGIKGWIQTGKDIDLEL